MDASAALAIVFDDEDGEKMAGFVEQTISGNGQIHVPELFWYEIANALLAAERRRRITVEESGVIASRVSELPIVSHRAEELSARERTLELARKHALTYYDASYLELALRLETSLATVDSHLVDLKSEYSLIL
jgi:predicted nucleic acid-binding protein